MASVSAPVVDAAHGVVAAIAVSGPIERLSRTPGKRFGAAVADAAAQIVLDADRTRADASVDMPARGDDGSAQQAAR